MTGLAVLRRCGQDDDEETSADKKKGEQLLADEPENIDVEAFAERLFLLDKIARAERLLANGQGIPHEHAKQKLAAWLK